MQSFSRGFFMTYYHNNFLGIILIILGTIVAVVALGDFIVRFAIAALGLYLIYHGLRLRNQHQRVMFFFHRMGNRKGPFF